MTARFSSARIKLLGSGHSLPGEAVDNESLLAQLETHCGKSVARRGRQVARRLGIKSRYLSRNLSQSISGTQEGVTAPDLCGQALRLSMGEAGIELPAVDYLLGHTTSPHTLLPPNISWVADDFNYPGPYMELRQACTGFANALQIAAAMVLADSQQRIAIVGSETGSAYFDIDPGFVDLEQLVNYVQMGDGAGAVILAADQGTEHAVITDAFVGHLGNGRDPGFHLQGGGSGMPLNDAGFPVFKHNVKMVRDHGQDLFEAGIAAITSRGYQVQDFDWILPHQANGHLAELFQEALDIPSERVYVTADTLGNLGSAAIWVSLDRLRRSGKLNSGDRVLVLGAEATKFLYGGFIYTH